MLSRLAACVLTAGVAHAFWSAGADAAIAPEVPPELRADVVLTLLLVLAGAGALAWRSTRAPADGRSLARRTAAWTFLFLVCLAAPDFDAEGVGCFAFDALVGLPHLAVTTGMLALSPALAVAVSAAVLHQALLFFLGALDPL